MALRLAQLLGQHAAGEALGEPLAVRGPRFVGRRHGLAQRVRIDGAAALGQRFEIGQAEGDQRAARGRRRVQRHGGASRAANKAARAARRDSAVRSS